MVHDLTLVTEDGESVTLNALLNSEEIDKLSTSEFEDLNRNIVQRLKRVVTEFDKNLKARLDRSEHFTSVRYSQYKTKVIVCSPENLFHLISCYGLDTVQPATLKAIEKKHPDILVDPDIQIVEITRNRVTYDR